jgi:hypothetical protein
MAAADGEELELAKLREARLWSMRFRDLLDDDRAAEPALRALVTELSVLPAAADRRRTPDTASPRCHRPVFGPRSSY